MVNSGPDSPPRSLRRHGLFGSTRPVGTTVSVAEAAVTITGQCFAGTTNVSFGGASVGFSVTDDATIRVTSPTGAVGQVVDVRITTPGGTTTVVAGDKFTYN